MSTKTITKAASKKSEAISKKNGVQSSSKSNKHKEVYQFEKPADGKLPASNKVKKKPAVPDAAAALFEMLGLDPRKAYSLGAPRKVFEVSFENEFGKKVLFTVEHPNKLALKDTFADLPVGMRTKKPCLRIVDVPAKAHFSFDEWYQLSQLALPGTWYYLGMPEEYKKAAKICAKIDPLGRIFGRENAGKQK
jgi:hypothetical protein